MLNETEIKYINENYNKIGATDCSRNLKRSRSAIVKNAKLLGLSLSHTDRSNIMRRKLDKPNNKRNVNPEQFINCKTKEIAYLLGFIWADGHISFKNTGCRITSNFVADDGTDLIPIFKKVGKWGIYTNKPKTKRQGRKQNIVQTNNRPLAEFLKSKGYITKSQGNACDILSVIPKKLHRYWWLGCFDGDGSFYVGKKYGQITLYSSYEQDWKHFDELSKNINVDYKLNKRITTRGNSSEIRVFNRKSILNLYKFLHPKKYELGLKRKFKKANILFKMYNKK